jgi:4-hydroxy-3-methylbut-2-enyl diphosphate reductase
VLHLHRGIKAEYDENQGEQRQIVIYGKNGHAEVIGLVGQTNGTAIVVENLNDASRLDFSRGISLYSQTTMSLAGFREIVDFIMNEMKARGTESQFRFFDTICRQVANRISDIRTFASNHDVIVFVCGKKSSNGRILYNECLQQNPQTHMVEQPKEIQPEWFNESSSVGICGATSTPKWLMEQCADAIRNMKL